MKGLQSFIGVMLFYAVLSYIVVPLFFFFYVEKTLMSAGNDFIVGSIISIIMWLSFRSYII